MPQLNTTPKAACLILILWAAVFLPFLGLGEVFQVSEGREGVVVREILSSGNYVLPLRNGEIVPSKPMLFHWLGAFTAQLRGQYGEWELRFPSALAALFILLLPIFALRDQLPVATLLLTSSLLLSMSGFYQLAVDGRVDMVFNAFVVALIFLWMRNPTRPPFLVMGLLAGCAVLTKGPLGVVLPGLVILSMSCVDGLTKRLAQTLFQPGWVISFIACLMVALPWYYLATTRGDAGFVQRQLFFENLLRFTGGEGITAKPFWFYVPAFFKESLPVGILAVIVIAVALNRSSEVEPRFIRLGVIWCLSGLFFLSLSTGKRSAYLVPLLPGLALALAVWLSAHWKSPESGMREWISKWGARLAAWILLFSMVMFTGALSVLSVRVSSASLAANSHQPTAPPHLIVTDCLLGAVNENIRLILAFILVAVAICSWGLWWNRRGQPIGAVWALFASISVPLILFVNIGLIAKGKTHSYKDFAAQLLERLPKDQQLGFVKTLRDESFDGLFFYYGRHVRMVNPDLKSFSPDGASVLPPGIYVARREWLQAGNLAGVALIELFQGGRRIDRPEKQLVAFQVESKVE